MKYDHRMVGKSLQVKKEKENKTIGLFMPPPLPPGCSWHPLKGACPSSIRITGLDDPMGTGRHHLSMPKDPELERHILKASDFSI